MKQFLGMRVQRDRVKKEIKIDQKQYLLEILEKFGMADANPVATPMVTNQKRNVIKVRVATKN